MPRQIETYEQAIAYLFGRINYERVSSKNFSADDFKLDRMRRLLSLLGDPHEQVLAIHIAGTKGKGSTAVMIAEILKAAGYRTGLFTSPHVAAFEERMQVDSALPSADQLVDLVNAVAEPVSEMDEMSGRMQPTYFELATALAWLHFTQQDVEYVVLEVGLGGRLDATNLCRPVVCVVTNISRDHTQILGTTLAEIAYEKSGIIKPGIPVISGVTDAEPAHVVRNTCRDRQAPLYELGREIRWQFHKTHADFETTDAVSQSVVDIETANRIWTSVPIPLLGDHQAHNAALAVAAVDALKIPDSLLSDDTVTRGMRAVKWPLRIEVVSSHPTVVLDAAHNDAAVIALLKTLNGRFQSQRRILIFAATQDKDVIELLSLLVPEFDEIILTQYSVNPRSVAVSDLQRMTQQVSADSVHTAPDVDAAWCLAQQLASPDDLICVTGSFFIAAEMRELLLDSPGDFPQRASNSYISATPAS